MAESTQTLTFKLVIDGKEALATLDLTKNEFVEIGEQLGKVANARTPMLDQFAKDLQTVDLASEEAAASIMEFIQVNQLTEKEISTIIQQLETESKTLAVNSAAWKQKVTAAANLRASMGSLMTQQVGMNNTMQAGTPGINQMRMAMNQFGYVLNDAQVFMINFRMGMMGISNNIPMIVQNFIQAKNAAGGTATTMQLITQSIMGGGGLIIGINALMLVINLLPSLFNDTTEAVADQTEEINKLVNEYERLTQVQIERKRSEVSLELSQLTADYQKRYGGRAEFLEALPLGLGNLFSSFKELSEEEQNQYTALVNQNRALDQASAKVGFRKDLENEINQLVEKRDSIKNPEAIKALDEWILRDKELLKQTELITRTTGPTEFEKAIKQLEAAQTHQLRMADIEEKGDAVILAMKKEQLVEQIKLYEKYKQDVTGLLYELVETEAALQKAIKPPEIPIEGEIEDIYLKDILNRNDYENSLMGNTLDNWYKLEDEKIKAYENYTDLKISLDEEYARRKAQIDEQVALNNIAILSQTLGSLAGLFAQHTTAYKVLAIAQATMDTYKAANVALASAPPPWNYIAMAGVIAAGLQNVSQILSVGVEQPEGFAEGGRLPAGKKGFIEGTHNELIAPEEDFKSIFKSYSGELVKHALMDARNFINISSSSTADSSGIKESLNRLNKHLDEGIKARAFLDDRQAKKIRNRGSAQYRRGKI